MFKLEDLSAICQTIALSNGHRSMVSNESFLLEAHLPFHFYQSILKDMSEFTKGRIIGQDGKEFPMEMSKWLVIQFPFNVEVTVYQSETDFLIRPVDKMAKIIPTTPASDLLRPTGGKRA